MFYCFIKSLLLSWLVEGWSWDHLGEFSLSVIFQLGLHDVIFIWRVISGIIKQAELITNFVFEKYLGSLRIEKV